MFSAFKIKKKQNKTLNTNVEKLLIPNYGSEIYNLNVPERKDNPYLWTLKLNGILHCWQSVHHWFLSLTPACWQLKKYI